MVKIISRKEERTITNYDLFAELAEGVFGRLVESKIIGPIKIEMAKQEMRIPIKKKDH